MSEQSHNPIINAHTINKPMVHANTLKMMEATMSSPDAVAGEIPAVPVQLITGEYIIPQSLSLKQLRHAVYAYIAEQENIAPDLLDTMDITEIQCFYVPCYQCKGTYQADWQVHAGYIPYITCCAEVDDDNLMWHPESGQLKTQYSTMLYAGCQLPEEAIRMLATVDSQDQIPDCDKNIFGGIEPEPFAIDLQQNGDAFRLDQIAHVIDTRIRQECTAGDSQKWWKWQINEMTCFARKVWMPIGKAVIAYKGKRYTFWCSGADSSCAICSKLPTGAGRAAQSMFGWLPLAVCSVIAIMGYLLMAEEMTSGFAAILLLVPLGYGLLRLLSIRSYGQKLGSFMAIVREHGRTGLSDMPRSFFPSLPKRPWIVSIIPYDKVFLPMLIVATVMASLAFQMLRG